MNTVTLTDLLANAQADIDAAIRKRDQIIATAQHELIDSGVDARRIRVEHGHPYVVGTTVELVDHYFVHERGHNRHSSVIGLRDGHDARYGADVMREWHFHIWHGAYVVVAADEQHVLVARTAEPSEMAHRRAVQRLRRQAQHVGLRVRVRDLQVALIGPDGSPVIDGDVISVVLWLLGVDETAETYSNEIREAVAA